LYLARALWPWSLTPWTETVRLPPCLRIMPTRNWTRTSLEVTCRHNIYSG
jgi:hypothetical protein